MKIKNNFKASMPLQANLKLSTNRPVVIHPHYEDVALRERVKRVYSHLYGFRPIDELHSILKHEYKANYLIMEKHFCVSHPPGKPECAMSNIAHIGMKKLTEQQACVIILRQLSNASKLFLKLFEINHISIYKIV
jgi:hypothetical protein